MSYNSDSGRPSRFPRFTGWLTMAPEVDAPGTGDILHNPSSPKASTHGLSFVGQRCPPNRRSESRSFSSSVGSRSDLDEFDVRSSFAPLAVFNKQPRQLQHKRFHDDDDDKRDGLTYKGRRWKGKTAHAVEQELETLRDVSLLSHAPDAVYLASRLEAVRRNLEIEEWTPRYLDYSSQGSSCASSFSETAAAAASPSRGLNITSSYSSHTDHNVRVGTEADDLLSPEIFDMDKPPASNPIDNIDSAARAAALEARIEIRHLRRSDLEQIRELHAFHGDMGRSPNPAETYTTSASFLLRLLVDDRHICLVAVAKPIPEPLDPLPSMGRRHELMANQTFSSTPSSNCSSLSTSPACSLFASSLLLDDDGADPLAADQQTRRQRRQRARGAAATVTTEATCIFSDGIADALPLYDGDKHDKNAATRHQPLAAPTTSFCPPSVFKVMSAPPPKGSLSLSQSEVVLGVISAQICRVQTPRQETVGFKLGDGDGDNDSQTAAVEAHLLTLSISPCERNQGLGAKMLSTMLEECQARAIRFAAKQATCTSRLVLRTYLEVHPSNQHAMTLYRSFGFVQPVGDRAIRRGFYRGDNRIPLSTRLGVNGTDAWVMERYS